MLNNSVRLIVGLGNPGDEYARTWHNLGFLALLALREAEDYRFGEWTTDRRANALLATSTLPGSRLLLAKPQTMMNNSGQAVAELLRERHLRPDDVWIVHDEIDLPLGEIRISRSASSAGHRGVQSIIDALGTNALTRFRIGCSTPERGETPAETYVLAAIPPAADAAVTAAIERAVQAILLAQLSGVPEAMNQFN